MGMSQTDTPLHPASIEELPNRETSEGLFPPPFQPNSPPVVEQAPSRRGADAMSPGERHEPSNGTPQPAGRPAASVPPPISPEWTHSAGPHAQQRERVSQEYPATVRDNGGSVGAFKDRRSRFHLPPSETSFGDGAKLNDTASVPERAPFVPSRWKAYTTPVAVEFKKPRRWWSYTAAVVLIAIISFEIVMVFDPGAIMQARTEALALMHRFSTADNNTLGNAQNGGANGQQQNSRTGTENAQNAQTPTPGQLPLPQDRAAASSELQAPTTGAPSSADEDENPVGPDASRPAQDAAARSSANPSGSQRPLGPQSQTRTPQRKPAYGRPGTPPVVNHDQYASRTSPAIPRNTPPTGNSVAPYVQSSESQSSSSPIGSNRPTTQLPASYSRNTGNPPTTSSQTSNPAPQQTTPANTSPQTAQNTQSPGEAALERWREQTAAATSTSRPAGTAPSSSTNQAPLAQRDQDAYARRPAPANTSTGTTAANPSAGASSEPKFSSVEMRGTSAPVPPSVPLSGVPSGSVAANSQFHGIRVPAELQSRGSQVGGKLQIGQLISSYSPVYPVEAAREGIEGTVRLDVLVGKDGTVGSVHVLSGPAMLSSAAATAVRDWRYGETFLDGQPIETQQYVNVVFRLATKSPQR